ncbi:MAG: DUF3800 domain-containing protein [Planctomycetaceae bacterium]|nr:DUF3800 domain-containing protein [Planctomycetaceae bacterium]
MWCFFDESYPAEGGVTAISACLMSEATVRRLDLVMYRARRRFYSTEHAKDMTKELKGQELLSNNAFKMEEKGDFRRLGVARQVFERCCVDRGRHPIHLFGTAIYGAHDVLKEIDHKKLAFPVRDILDKVSCAAQKMKPNGRVNLVFDEQLGHRDMAIAIRRFVAGVKLKNVSDYPLTGVSHVTPGIQLADMTAYVLARYAVGDPRFLEWMNRLRVLEWSGQVNGYDRRGFQTWEKNGDGKLVVRYRWSD